MTELIYKEFEQYELKDFSKIGFSKTDGIHHIFIFPNGLGASVIKHRGSYGFESDLFELAVISRGLRGWDLCYTTEITHDVEGWLTNEDVLNLLEKIKNL